MCSNVVQYIVAEVEDVQHLFALFSSVYVYDF